MPSTFTPVLQLEKPGDGEQEGFWGSTVNSNMDAIETAILGSYNLDGGAAALTTPSAGMRRITVPAAGEILVEQYSGTAWATIFDSRTKAGGSAGSFVAKAGDTMTGALVLNGPGIAALNPVSKAQFDAALAANATADQAFATSAVAAVATSASPVGSITMYGGQTAPAGWAECDGGALNRITNAALFAVVGNSFGNGDGLTTFNKPDMRGQFARGWDHGRGVDASRSFGSTQTDSIKAHTHPDGADGAFPGSTTPGGFATINQAGSGTGSQTGSTGGDETRPTNVAVMFIIKL